jgi:hypothetical protein
LLNSEKNKIRYNDLKSKGLCVCCGDSPAVVPSGHGRPTIKFCIECRNRINQGRSEKRLQQKSLVLTHYGPNNKLKCCWDGCEVCDPDMLSLDHIDNTGNEDRKKTGLSGITLYYKLIKQGFPQGFQTLCHNHQWKKEILRRRADINGTPTWRK